MMHGKNHQKRNRNKRRADFLAGLRFETLEARELLAADLGFDVVPEGEGGHDHGSDSFGSAYIQAGEYEGGSGYLTGTNTGRTPLSVAQEYFEDHADDLGFNPSDFESYRVVSQVYSQHTRVSHFVFQQQYNNLDVEGALAVVAVDNDGSIISAGANFIPDLNQDYTVTNYNTDYGQVDAFARVANALGLTITSQPNVVSSAGGISQKVQLSSGGIANGTISAELKYIPTANGPELSWIVEFRVANEPLKYNAAVAADTGEVFYANNIVKKARYNVYPLPSMSPLETTESIVVDPADSLTSPFGWHDTNGVPGSEFTDTRGNNIFAQMGEVGVGLPVVTSRPDGGAGHDFLLQHDPAMPANNPDNIDFAAQQAFYYGNITHDVLARYGFDEGAGNFQATNYSGLFGGGDQMVINVYDADAICNAYYGPSPDGTIGIIEMGFCGNTVPSRDSSLDASVLIHEYAHGLVERLVAGPLMPAGSTGDDQIGGMHEGTADYLALFFTMDINDAPDTPVEVGEYYFGTGGRRNPYAYDLTVDPITFDAYNPNIDPTNLIPNNEVHNAGEIWASALYDLTWELIFKYGGSRDASAMANSFNANLYQAVGGIPGGSGGIVGTSGLPITTSLGPDLLDLTTGANNLAMQLITDGMKLSPFAPTFTNARDSILAADAALTGGVNQDAIWNAFARRGLGYSSFSGIDTTVDTVSAAYDLPPTPADISGTIFMDANENQVQDINEFGMEGWTVYLDLNQNGTHERLEPTADCVAVDITGLGRVTMA